jgi:hypothetical protein
VRRFLQELGTGVRDIDPNFWINAWADKAASYLRNIVVPDVRFLNEAEYLRENGALLIRIGRPGLDNGDRHISETEHLSIQEDEHLINSGSRELFEATVLDVVDEWMNASVS